MVELVDVRAGRVLEVEIATANLDQFVLIGTVGIPLRVTLREGPGSLPLDGRGRLAAYVINNARNISYLIDDA